MAKGLDVGTSHIVLAADSDAAISFTSDDKFGLREVQGFPRALSLPSNRQRPWPRR
jgi:hypothetical protein